MLMQAKYGIFEKTATNAFACLYNFDSCLKLYLFIFERLRFQLSFKYLF